MKERPLIGLAPVEPDRLQGMKCDHWKTCSQCVSQSTANALRAQAEARVDSRGVQWSPTEAPIPALDHCHEECGKGRAFCMRRICPGWKDDGSGSSSENPRHPAPTGSPEVGTTPDDVRAMRLGLLNEIATKDARRWYLEVGIAHLIDTYERFVAEEEALDDRRDKLRLRTLRHTVTMLQALREGNLLVPGSEMPSKPEGGG